MHPTIQTALAQLDKADINGFFQSIKTVVPPQHEHQFNALRKEFISGKSPWDFEQQLRAFAHLVADSLDKNTHAMEPKTPLAQAAAAPSKPLRVFISFSQAEHRHEQYSKAIKNHLHTLIQNKQVQVWDRTDLRFGEMDPQIRRELEQADVLVALMSSDYFSDQAIWNMDFAIAQEKVAKGQLVVVPVVLRAFNWEDTWLGKFPPLPRDKNPIKRPENDEAWVELEALLNHILLERAQVVTTSSPVPPAASFTPPPSPAPSSGWDNFVRFWRDLPTIIKGIGALVTALVAVWAYFYKPPVPVVQEVTLKGELFSAETGRPLEDLEVWIKDHRDLGCVLRAGTNTFNIQPVDPKMDNNHITLVVDFKGAQYSDELVNSNLINLSNFDVQNGALNLGEVRIHEPLKAIAPPSQGGSSPKSKNVRPIVLTGKLNIQYPGKTIQDVARVFLTDYPTNDDKSVDGSGTFKIPLEKPISDGLYKITVEFKDRVVASPILKKQLEKTSANGELSLGVLDVYGR